MRLPALPTLAIAIACSALVSAAPAQAWKTPWSYAGAAHWGALDPAYAACAGRAQSPVDIRQTQSAELPALRFEFKSGPMTIVNNGYTAARVNYAAGNGNLLLVGGQRYELTQLHFHHPSEEYIHGEPHVMGMHLMFQASDGEVAAVAVMLKLGRENPVIGQIWQHMPPTPGPARTIAGVEFNPAGLLPRQRGYYTYTGSLTAPPCTEGVRWIVLRTPIEVSAAQVAAFARLYPRDVRPLQPLNGRVVKESR